MLSSYFPFSPVFVSVAPFSWACFRVLKSDVLLDIIRRWCIWLYHYWEGLCVATRRELVDTGRPQRGALKPLTWYLLPGTKLLSPAQMGRRTVQGVLPRPWVLSALCDFSLDPYGHLYAYADYWDHLVIKLSSLDTYRPRRLLIRAYFRELHRHTLW